MTLFSSRRALKAIGCSALVALSVGLVSQAHAQNGYYQTNFDGDTSNQTLSGQDGWTDSDSNQPDGVGIIGGYSAPSPAKDNIASVGGDFLNSGGGPSGATAYLAHGFTSPTVSYRIDTDYFVTKSTSTYPNANSFGFTLQNATGLNLFSINLVPNGSTYNTETADAIRYTTYNALGTADAQVSTGLGSVLGSRYHLDISVNEATNSFIFTITLETPTGTLSATPAYTSPSITLDTGVLASSVNSIAALYTVTPSTDGVVPGSGAGSNALFFDNFSAVPEPSTWAMMGLGVLGLVVSFRRKVRA